MQTATMDLRHVWRFVVSGMGRGYSMLRDMFYINREMKGEMKMEF